MGLSQGTGLFLLISTEQPDREMADQQSLEGAV